MAIVTKLAAMPLQIVPAAAVANMSSTALVCGMLSLCGAATSALYWRVVCGGRRRRRRDARSARPVMPTNGEVAYAGPATPRRPRKRGGSRSGRSVNSRLFASPEAPGGRVSPAAAFAVDGGGGGSIARQGSVTSGYDFTESPKQPPCIPKVNIDRLLSLRLREIGIDALKTPPTSSRVRDINQLSFADDGTTAGTLASGGRPVPAFPSFESVLRGHMRHVQGDAAREDADDDDDGMGSCESDGSDAMSPCYTPLAGR